MKQWNDLDAGKKEQLLDYPVYISLLAMAEDGEFTDTEKKAATDLAQVKTYSSEPEWKSYYETLDGRFESRLEQLNQELPKDRKQRKTAIKQRLNELQKIADELDAAQAKSFYDSMNSFKENVSRAHRNVLHYVLFPLPFDGLSD